MTQIPAARSAATPQAYLVDLEGGILFADRLVPGADRFLAALRAAGHPFLLLTNNPRFTPRDLRARLLRHGVDVPEDAIWTSALATAEFLAGQRPGGTAYAIGDSGLTTALHGVGYTLTERDPDYVVLGETRAYSFDRITTAIRLVGAGARFVATNRDATGQTPAGEVPATGSVGALITRATGVEPYYVGKPNPLMLRSALRRLGARSASAVVIGDRMDTDVVAGLEAGLETVLVLSGVTDAAAAARYPYRPSRVVASVADLVEEVRGDLARPAA